MRRERVEVRARWPALRAHRRRTVIDAKGLTKRYGPVAAVDDLTFTVRSGCITGFLGPNGAGKSTTMRMCLGLDRADAGTVRIGGRQLRDIDTPMRAVGALLDAGYVHPTRRAEDHLWALASSNLLPRRRVGEVLGLVGLSDAARKRVGTFSLGMKQRLGLAAALLGDPQTLLFDEPANGLDPEGILWMRRFLRSLADEGRTVFVSSHQLSEMALMADDLVVIGRGRLMYTGGAAAFTESSARRWVSVSSPGIDKLAAVLRRAGCDVTPNEAGGVDVTGATPAEIGDAALAAGTALHELTARTASLEDVFLDITAPAQEYRTAPAAPPGPGAAGEGGVQ